MLLVSILCSFAGASVRTELMFADGELSVPEKLEADTTQPPRFPVKKTQITNQKDLEVNPPADLKTPSNIKTEVTYDELTKLYIFRTKVGDEEIGVPYYLTQSEYMDYTLKQSMASYFKAKNSRLDADGKSKDDFSLKDIKLNLNPAEKIFGPGGVKLKANGYVETSMGIKYNKTDNPTLSERNRARTAFDFNEDIQMNVTASVGDKINFGMNYDTKAMFDFDSKKINLAYDANQSGDEDAILKRIEAGNVSMTTTNSLINGGSALFGISAEMQFGKLKVRTILSQQESQFQSVNSNGNIQTTNYEFKADQYDENRHFFLGHYFRDNYDNAMSKLPFVQSAVNITRIEVWITNKKNDYSQSRNIVAFADVAEHTVIKNPKWHATGTADLPYNGANNLYSTITSTYTTARDISQVTTLFSGYLEGAQDYEKVESARLLSSSEYTFNSQLGYLSLLMPLQADEVLAVAYEYKKDGKTYQVGEFSADIVDKYDAANPKSGSLFVKMLKPVSLSPRAYTWDLMMKNVYYIGATNIQKDKFRLNISYQADTLGTYINYIPEGEIKNEMLLKVMNLDRLDSRNNANPDGIFDFVEGYTVKADNGRIYFPVVEPFGSHLKKKINNSTIAEKYIYQELYDSTLTVARQIAEKNKYKISGTYRGSSTNAEINLGATNVPQGSVKVTANGVLLAEGVDYIVDYMSGSVTVINQNLIDSNAPIQVSLEDRTFSMQRRTLLGLNLSYDISKDFNIGGTIMHMYEKPLTTKTEIGNESVKNTLWGLNASYKTQSQWLTNLVDKLPFVNATQPSQISLNAEFAHMIPGHYESKENGGYSYLDDFENSESRIDIKSPYGWKLAATPFDKSSSPLFPEAALSNDAEYGKNRAMLSWFMIDGMFNRKNSSLTPQHIKNDKEQLSNHFVREIYMWELYPQKDVIYSESSTIPALNLTYYPDERGPYNMVFRDKNNLMQFDQNGKLLKPEERWGGITRKMDVRDFESSNIEYIEFWLMDPFVYNNISSNPNKGGEFYINLGEISEDILKDGKKFYENGLPVNDDPSAYEYTVWGKVPTRQSVGYVFDDNQGAAGRAKQDVGLNGLSTEEEFGREPYKSFVEDYKNNLNPSVADEMMKSPNSPLRDPAGDTFHHYRGSDYDRDEVGILDRYKYFNGTEGNSPATSETSESYSTAAQNVPDVEDVDQDNTLNENETYFQYKIDLKPERMKVGDNYIVDSRTVKVPLANGKDGEVTWYQFKVPVRNYDKKVGNIQDFKSIRFMRMFLTKFDQATSLRFGTLQLVRGDWRTYEPTLKNDGSPSGNGVIDISTVNIEENSERKPVNYVLPPGVSRVNDPDQVQLTKENEQALSMRITNLDSEDARAIYKNTNYDLRRYKRLQLFTHAEKQLNGQEIAKGELTVFLRLGTDYKNNYYEYEIPLTITPDGTYSSNSSADRLAVWPADNTFDFPLELLKDIKLNRNREKRKTGSTVSYTTLYSEYDPDKQSNKVSVIGNPSLAEVNVIMVGVRNNSRTEKSGEVWINELRLTDFDEEGGWAAQGNLNIVLSDLGSVSFSGRKETVGFGSIDQSLLERRSDDYQLYNISANVDVGRFLPEKAKLNIPFYYAYSNQKNTPKYDPFDKDVTLKEALSLVETKAEKDSIKSLAIESNITKSISFSNVKVNIKSKTPMPYDPANFSFGYTYSQNEIKNPTTEYDKAQDYKASMSYSYSPLMKTWEPFKGVKGRSNTAKFAKSVGINYLPNNITFNSNMTRYYTETMVRDIEGYSVGESNAASRFLSWSQSFYWDRDFSLAWDFTRNLKATFQSGTRAEIEEPYLQVNKKLNRDAYDRWKDTVMQSIKNLGTPLEYKQIAKVTYQLPTRNIAVLDWITSNASYTSNYNWNRGAEIEDAEVGNVINNSLTIDFNNRLDLTRLYNKSAFLKRVNSRFDAAKKQQTTERSRTTERRPKQKKLTKTVFLNKDSATTIVHGLDVKDIRVTARKDSSTYKISFKRLNNNTIRINNRDSVQIEVNILEKIKDPNEKNLWTDIAEYSARGMMSIRNLTVNYSKRKETYISGFRPSVGDAFGQKNSEFGLAPGLGFAFGLDGGDDFIQKSMDRDWLVINSMNITPAIYNNANKFELKSQIEPFKGLKIELNVAREDNKRTEIEYMYDGMPRTLGGSFSMTTVALSSALKSSNAKDGYYSEAFEKFLDNRNVIRRRLESKYRQTRYPSGGFMDDVAGLAGQDYSPSIGAVDANSGDVLIPAFLAAYTGRDANSISLSAFPSFFSMLPNWTASYDGLMNIQLIKDKFKSLRLNHSYTCFYQVNSYESFSNWLSAGTGDDLGYIRDVLSGKPVPSSPYNMSSVSIAETFNPLFGVDGSLNNNMSFNMQYNSTRMLNLNMSAYQIIESLKKEVVVGMGYRIDEFNRVIGLTPKRPRKRSVSTDDGKETAAVASTVNNDLNLRMDLSHSTTQALIRKIEERFTQATSGVTIITLKFSADYTLSRALTLRAFFDRIVNTPLVTAGSYPTTNSNFGISVKFTLLQ